MLQERVGTHRAQRAMCVMNELVSLLNFRYRASSEIQFFFLNRSEICCELPLCISGMVLAFRGTKVKIKSLQIYLGWFGGQTHRQNTSVEHIWV